MQHLGQEQDPGCDRRLSTSEASDGHGELQLLSDVAPQRRNCLFI